jgi:hypothetical protein
MKSRESGFESGFLLLMRCQYGYCKKQIEACLYDCMWFLRPFALNSNIKRELFLTELIIFLSNRLVITFVSREINGFIIVLNSLKKLVIRVFISVTGGV